MIGAKAVGGDAGDLGQRLANARAHAAIEVALLEHRRAAEYIARPADDPGDDDRLVLVGVSLLGTRR